MGGREDAIRDSLCIAPPLGCGRNIQALFQHWDPLTQAEYLQSGWCRTCQDLIFRDPEEEDDEGRCTCNDPDCCEVDVGVGIITCAGQHAMPCPVHEVDENFEFRIYEHDIDDPLKLETFLTWGNLDRPGLNVHYPECPEGCCS